MGQKIKISDPLNPVEPGQGICVVFTSYWPGDHVGGTPDNAAQGDSLTFNAKFDLEQHF